MAPQESEFAQLYHELLREHRKLMGQHRDLMRELHAAQSALREVEISRNAEPSLGPMHMNEDEEDAKHMLAAGKIDRQTYADIMASLGFQNDEVTEYH